MRALKTLPLLAATLVALMAGATTSASPTAPAAQGLIALVRHSGSGTSDLYVVRPDGSGLRKLSRSPVDHDPAWTPDGRLLVFASSRGGRDGATELYSRDLAGRDTTRLTRTEHSPQNWSASAQPVVAPDGKHVVFVRATFVDGRSTVDLFETEIIGWNERRLTQTEEREESPAFGPNGEIYFVVEETIYVLEDGRVRKVVRGSDPAPRRDALAFARQGSVYMLAGGRARKIATGTAPAWSPDGTRIVYSGRDGLYTVRADGTQRQRITRAALPAAHLDAAWQPAMRRLAVAVDAADAPIVYATGSGGPAGRPTDIYVRNGNGEVRRLTRTRAYEGFPSWSPDRRRIVFVRAVAQDSDIYVMNADGSGVRRLAGSRRGAQDLYPAWSPDGRLIAFSSNRYGEPDIYVMRSDGTGLRRLTVTPRWVEDAAPRFSPDGRYIVFTSNRVAFANYELFRVRVSDGRGLKRLTFWGSDDLHALGDDVLPEYSPDGSRIAFVSDRGGDYAIWTMRATDGKDLSRVVGHKGLNVAFPRWSPDGRTLLYTTFSSSVDLPADFRLRTVPAEGGTPTEIGPGAEADW